jgi:hypothetical protein
VAEPVEEFGEAPFRGVDAAAPVESFEGGVAAAGGDFRGFALGAVVAPEVILVEGLKAFGEWDDSGASGIESDGGDRLAGDAGELEGLLSGGAERVHVIVVALSGVVRIFRFAVDGVFRAGGGEAAYFTVKEGDADTLGPEIDTGYDGHTSGIISHTMEAGVRPYHAD